MNTLKCFRVGALEEIENGRRFFAVLTGKIENGRK
jgi:hypothetical protein